MFNKLLKLFKVNNYKNIIKKSGSNKSTHKSQGILDLGGASTQIVFVPASNLKSIIF